jgi:hypothetical protein
MLASPSDEFGGIRGYGGTGRMRVNVRMIKRAAAALAVGIGLIGLIAALSVRAPAAATPRAATAVEYAVN